VSAVIKKSEVSPQTALEIISKLREVKLRQLERERNESERKDNPVNEDALSIKIRAKELPKYAACLSLAQFVEKKSQALSLTAFRAWLRATHVPNSVDVGTWVTGALQTSEGCLAHLMDKLCEIAT